MNDFLRVPLHVLPAESGCVIDCDTCSVRGAACDDCVVSVMLGGPPGALPIEPDEHRALAVLAGAGLVPPLQMTPPPGSGPAPGARPGPTAAAPTAPASAAANAPTDTAAPSGPAPRSGAPGPGRPGPDRDDRP